MKSLSILMIGVPALTFVPASTNCSKPSPFKLTVSTPIWINNSSPFSNVIANACLVLNTNDNSPSAGATIVSPVTIIAAPSPAIFPAKTGSGTSDKGIKSPVATATNAFFGLSTVVDSTLFDCDLPNNFLKKLAIILPDNSGFTSFLK